MREWRFWQIRLFLCAVQSCSLFITPHTRGRCNHGHPVSSSGLVPPTTSHARWYPTNVQKGELDPLMPTRRGSRQADRRKKQGRQ